MYIARCLSAYKDPFRNVLNLYVEGPIEDYQDSYTFRFGSNILFFTKATFKDVELV